MKSQPTSWTRTGKTARDVIAVVGGPSKIKEDLTVPAGTKVVFSGHWVVHDFAWLDGNSSRHDAEHYGIAIDDVDVTGVREVKRKAPPAAA